MRREQGKDKISTGEQGDVKAEPATTRSTHPTEEGSARMYLEPLTRILVRDADLVGDDAGGGALRARAGEALEFGRGDLDRAEELYRQAARHGDADPLALAGLRRVSRAHGNIEGIRRAYERELDGAASAEQRVVAGTLLASFRMRRGEDAHDTLEFIFELEPLTEVCCGEVQSLFSMVLEDALVRNGRTEEAAELRASRLDATDVTGAGALAGASFLRAVGATDELMLGWFERAFALDASGVAMRPMLRRAMDAEAWDVAEALLTDLVARAEDIDARSSARYQLGMLRAFRTGDPSGGLDALSESIRAGETAPVAASAYLSAARCSQGSVVADDFVDALGARVEFAASSVERADLLTQMARRLDEALGMPEAAVEMAEEALQEAADWIPAIRVLTTIYSREGQWDRLAELLEKRLEFEENTSEIRRTREQLAEVYQDHLHNADAAERHLREALGSGQRPHLVRRLARLYSEQGRWQELHVHLMKAADGANTVREKTYLTEEAAEVAEHRLRDSERAIDSYLALLQLDTTNATAMSGLDRLYRATERWSELIRLNQHELEQIGRGDGTLEARIAILNRCAQLAAGPVGDHDSAESFLVEALELDPCGDDSLRQMGRLLQLQSRWSDLAEVTDRQLRATDDPTVRVRCLRQLGEIYTTHTNETKRAIDCFRALAEEGPSYREEARIWLERLYEAAGMREARLDLLEERRDAAADPLGAARLSFRIGELLEWELSRFQPAFAEYLSALSDPRCLTETLAALDRLWCARGVGSREHLAALRAVQDLAGRVVGTLRKSCLYFVAERADGVLDDDERRTVWSTIAREWPDEVSAVEHVAVQAIRDGDVEYAEELRARCPVGDVEAVRSRWAQLDRCIVDAATSVEVPQHGELAGMLAREERDAHGFEGADDRRLFQLMAEGRVTQDALRGRGGSDAARLLSIMAARSMGEDVALRREWMDYIASLSDDRRGLRAWLDLCEEQSATQSERQQWLRSADACGCYGLPLREELYVAFRSSEDHEGYIDAISNHLNSGDVDGEEAANLALRRGHALDRLGRREEALESMRFATIHAPAMTAAAVERSRLEQQLGQVDAARQSLEDVLDAGASGRERLEVLGRLADLNLLDGGSHERAVEALEDAWELSGRTRDWTLRLARAHATYGDAERSVELLSGALGDEPVEDDLQHWLLLARVEGGSLGRTERAEATLWKLFRAFPERPNTLEALHRHYKKEDAAERFANLLRDCLNSDDFHVSDARAATLWSYVGELFLKVVRKYPEAQYAFVSAERANGGTAHTKLCLAQAYAAEQHRVRDAVGHALDCFAANDATPGIWMDAGLVLDEAFGTMDDGARQRTARQLRCALGDEGVSIERRISPTPQAQLEPERVWELLGTGLFEQSEVHVLQAAASLAERVVLRKNARRHVRGNRLDEDASGLFLDALDQVCWAYETRTPRVVNTESDCGIVSHGDEVYLVHEPLVEGSRNPAAQFWAGYTAAAAFSELSTYFWVDDSDTLELLRAVGQRAKLVPQAERSVYYDDVGGFMLANQRRAVVQELRDAPEFFETAGERAWMSSLQRFCDRSGLVACGDVGAAVACIGQSEPGSSASRSSRVRALVDYAFSDDYYVARFELKLGRRPVLLSRGEGALRAV